MAPPGYPNTTLTPSRTSDSQMLCAPISVFFSGLILDLPVRPTPDPQPQPNVLPSRCLLERVGRRLAGRRGPAARIRAENPEQRRELGQVRERARAGRLVARRRDIGVEEILPFAVGNRPGFE